MPIILARVYQRAKRRKRTGKWPKNIGPKCQQFPSSSCFPITYLFCCTQTTHFHCIITFPACRPQFIKLHIYLDRANVCNRPLTDISFLRMRYPSASLSIEDKGPAAVRCRQNVSQCSVPTNIILYLYSPLWYAMKVHKSVLQRYKP